MSIRSQQEIHSCQVWPAMADASLTSAEAIMADAKAGQDEVLKDPFAEVYYIDSRFEINVVSRTYIYIRI